MAESTIEMIGTEPILATANTDYIGQSWLYITRIGRLVNVSGRFRVISKKPSGLENYLFSGLPVPKGKTVGLTLPNTNTELVINSEGLLTSADEVPAIWYDVQYTYST